MGTGFFAGVKRLERDVYHSPRSSAEVRMAGPIHTLLLYAVHVLDKDNFTFYVAA